MKNKIVLFFLYIVPFILAASIVISALYDWLLQEFEGLIVGFSGFSLSVPRLEELPVENQIIRIFGEVDAPFALAISQAENGTRKCDRVGVSGDIGVFQIAPQYHAWRGDLTDCTENIRIAKEIFDEQGWWPWRVYQTGVYRRFLR